MSRSLRYRRIRSSSRASSTLSSNRSRWSRTPSSATSSAQATRAAARAPFHLQLRPPSRSRRNRRKRRTQASLFPSQPRMDYSSASGSRSLPMSTAVLPTVATTSASTPRAIPHWIGGKAVAGSSGRTANVYNPATGQVQALVPLANRAELDAAVAAAEAAFPAWSRAAIATSRASPLPLPRTL